MNPIRFTILGILFGLIAVSGAQAGTLRQYFIAAEEIDWDYVPAGRDLMMGQDFTDEQKVFVKAGPSRIGHIYRKARYSGFTDASFATRIAPESPSMGLIGPVIRAEVGDTIEVTFKNLTAKPLSVHPHGVFYLKDSEGSMTNDGTPMAHMADDAVPPGAVYIYHWQVPERAGPGPDDPSSIVWLYHAM